MGESETRAALVGCGGDDTTTAACEFQSGRLCVLEASYCADSHIFALYGTKGFASVTNSVKLDIQLDGTFEGESIRYDEPGQLLSQSFDVSTAEPESYADDTQVIHR